jgi:hypothetical protein
MISQLASPSVCVIDDEEQDYVPILNALNALFVSCVHLRGDNTAQLPPAPFVGLRLVFLDLHLSAGATGQTSASHTANVFIRVVSSDTAPIVVVIWSKYASDRVAVPGVPLDDQETEAELFKRTLLEAEPKYKGRLIFIEMDKPKPATRPRGWNNRLKAQIRRTLKGQSAVDALWGWELLVKAAYNAVSEGLTDLAWASSEQTGAELTDSLKETMKRLAKAEGEGDLSSNNAHRYLAAALTELLDDQLEHSEGIDTLSGHGSWLSSGQTGVAGGFAQKMNGLLLTAGVPGKSAPFGPGTVYRVTRPVGFAKTFGKEQAALMEACWGSKLTEQTKDKWNIWSAAVRPVVIEISPVCDVAQEQRVTSLMVAGLLAPADMKGQIKRDGGAWSVLPSFHLRWPWDDFPVGDVVLIFCHRYKASFPASSSPRWIKPWFRLRELPTTAIRNIHCGHASRVGYVSLHV